MIIIPVSTLYALTAHTIVKSFFGQKTQTQTFYFKSKQEAEFYEKKQPSIKTEIKECLAIDTINLQKQNPTLALVNREQDMNKSQQGDDWTDTINFEATPNLKQTIKNNPNCLLKVKEDKKKTSDNTAQFFGEGGYHTTITYELCDDKDEENTTMRYLHTSSEWFVNQGKEIKVTSCPELGRDKSFVQTANETQQLQSTLEEEITNLPRI